MHPLLQRNTTVKVWPVSMQFCSVTVTKKATAPGHLVKATGSQRYSFWLTPIVLGLCMGLLSHATVAGAATRRALLIGIGAYSPPAGSAVAAVPGTHPRDSRFAAGASWVSLQGPLIDVAAMKFLLTNQFGFPANQVTVLDQHEATRRGILTALDRLIAESQPGDTVVLYYSGHGSRRLDTLSSKNHFDETIVPVDAWKGSEDIRDKELAARFDQIVYDKHAHLTAIFDSCNSGTMARGITQSTTRSLPYDDRDVAEEKRRDPQTIVEADLKRIPQDGDAIIIAAAASNESAFEGLYDDDKKYHGAFTRALVRVLGSSTQTLSAADVVAQVAAAMHADRVEFQQPSIEGRVDESLFGAPVAAHNLNAHVLDVSSDGIILDLGSAASFDVGTQFTSIDSAPDGSRTRLEVQSVDEPLKSVAIVTSGPPDVKVSQTFELTRMVYPRAARLKLFIPPAESDPAAAVAAATKAFPAVAWSAEPADKPIDVVVYRSDQGWRALDQNGREITDVHMVRGNGFLLLGPPASLQQDIRASVPFASQAFTISSDMAKADYVMTLRRHPDGAADVSLLDPIALSNQDRSAWVRSSEHDADDATLNGNAAPDVVCRNQITKPVRTAWLPISATNENDLARAVLRRIVRLGKLRAWLGTPELAPGISGWPYHLEVTAMNGDAAFSGPLALHQPYQVRLVTTASARATNNPIPRYVYVMGFDCAANPYLIYPKRNMNGDATLPQPAADGVYPLSISLGIDLRVGLPLGADTLFLLVTSDKLTDPGSLLQDGALQASARGSTNRFDELITHDFAARGPDEVPSTWTVQQLLVPSR